MVDWLFLPQNFGPMVGTYEGLLQLCECTLGDLVLFSGGGDTSPLYVLIKLFLAAGGGDPKT